MGEDLIVVDHGAQIVLAQLMDLIDFMRGTEAVEEVDEGDARLQGGRMGDQRQILRLLHRGAAQHGEAGTAGRHHVLMVAEDRQPLGRQ